MRDSLLDTDPITLSEASEIVLRGVVSVSALRAEIQRGNLVAFKVGKNLFTTPAQIGEMMDRCRVNPAPRDSTSDQTTVHGSSETAKRSSELDALNVIVAGLKGGSQSTSRKSTPAAPQSVAKVTPFRLPKSSESTP